MRIIKYFCNLIRKPNRDPETKEAEDREWTACVACKYNEQCCRHNYGYGCYEGEGWTEKDLETD